MSVRPLQALPVAMALCGAAACSWWAEVSKPTISTTLRWASGERSACSPPAKELRLLSPTSMQVPRRPPQIASPGRGAPPTPWLVTAAMKQTLRASSIGPPNSWADWMPSHSTSASPSGTTWPTPHRPTGTESWRPTCGRRSCAASTRFRCCRPAPQSSSPLPLPPASSAPPRFPRTPPVRRRCQGCARTSPKKQLRDECESMSSCPGSSTHRSDDSPASSNPTGTALPFPLVAKEPDGTSPLPPRSSSPTPPTTSRARPSLLMEVSPRSGDRAQPGWPTASDPSVKCQANDLIENLAPFSSRLGQHQACRLSPSEADPRPPHRAAQRKEILVRYRRPPPGAVSLDRCSQCPQQWSQVRAACPVGPECGRLPRTRTRWQSPRRTNGRSSTRRSGTAAGRRAMSSRYRSLQRRWETRRCLGVGAGMAVDELGIGYSSLAYLRQFPIDVLK